MRILRTRPPRHVAELIHGPLSGEPPPGFTREIKRSMFRQVLSMGMPSMAGFLVMTIYELVDMFWLAKIGAAPVAAVTMCSTILYVVSFTNMIVGPGSMAIIARRFGEGDLRRTELSIKNTFLLKFVLGLLFGLPTVALLPYILNLLGATVHVNRLGVAYGTVQMSVLGLAMVGFSVYTALRSIGRPMAALYIQIATTVINCTLDPLLIFGWGPFPELGITGAALATAIAQLFVVIAGIAVLGQRSSPVRVRWLRAPWPDFKEQLQMIRIGLPAGVNQLSFSLATFVVVRLVAAYGTATVAVYGMSIRVLHFGIMAVVGLGLGTGALIGQFLGSRDLLKAWLAGVQSIRLAVGIMTGFAVVVLLGAPAIVRLFFSDPALAEPGALILRVMALSLPFIGLHIGSEIVFEGAGQNTPPMLLSIVHSWVMVVPLMYTASVPLQLGPAWTMGAWGVAHVFGGIAAVWLFHRGSWLRHEV